MLITKINPAGIDWYLQNAQTQLHTRLLKVWGADVKYNCYGRCYRNKVNDGYVAEVYTGNREYKEVYWDDSLAAISFFGINNTSIKSEVGNKVEIHLVFFTDLVKLALKDRQGNTIAHRSDEEVRQDVLGAMGKFSFGLTFQSIELWTENVLKEYPGSRRDERLKAVDMHPVHCFRFNYTLIYDPNKTC